MTKKELLFGKDCHSLGENEEPPMGTMNISLPDPMKSWVESQTRTGRFANTSDYVRDLIRRDQARAEVIATLQSAIDEGVQSGDPKPMDTAAFLVRMRDQHGR